MATSLAPSEAAISSYNEQSKGHENTILSTPSFVKQHVISKISGKGFQ